MNKNYKGLFIAVFLIIFLVLLSEVVNIISNPTSPSAAIITRYFIKKSIQESNMGNMDESLNYLNIASKVNVIGEYGPYRKLARRDYADKIILPDNDALKSDLKDYISSLTSDDFTNAEDQGLSWFFYKMALIANKNNDLDLTEKLLIKAVYNYPEFPTFHGELANFYLKKSLTEGLNKEMDYCSKFEKAKDYCQLYRDDSIKKNTAQEIGFMEKAINEYYFSQ